MEDHLIHHSCEWHIHMYIHSVMIIYLYLHRYICNMLMPVDLKEKVRLGRCMWMFESQRPSGDKTLWYSWRLLLGGAGYQSKISQYVYLFVFLTRSREVFFSWKWMQWSLPFQTRPYKMWGREVKTETRWLVIQAIFHLDCFILLLPSGAI